MANTIKPPRLRKKAVGFSIKLGVIQDLKDYCKANNIIPSNLVESLIIEYLNKKERGI